MPGNDHRLIPAQLSDTEARRSRAARWVSVAAHPFVMTGLLVGTTAAARQAADEAARTVMVTLLVAIAPIALLMFRQVRRGIWGNADASRRSERPTLFLVGGIALVALFVYVAVLRPQSFMVRGVAGTLGMLGVCALATRWTKVSLHMAFGAFAGTTLALMGSAVGYAILLVLPVLAWARLTLGRHTRFEVAIGALIGLAAGAGLYYL